MPEALLDTIDSVDPRCLGIRLWSGRRGDLLAALRQNELFPLVTCHSSLVTGKIPS